jgi:hypothetical protein
MGSDMKARGRAVGDRGRSSFPFLSVENNYTSPERLARVRSLPFRASLPGAFGQAWHSHRKPS